MKATEHSFESSVCPTAVPMSCKLLTLYLAGIAVRILQEFFPRAVAIVVAFSFITTITLIAVSIIHLRRSPNLLRQHHTAAKH